MDIPKIDDRNFISSPGYPTSYSENAYCYWEVDVPNDVEVILEFNPRLVSHMIWSIIHGLYHMDYMISVKFYLY